MKLGIINTNDYTSDKHDGYSQRPFGFIIKDLQ